MAAVKRQVKGWSALDFGIEAKDIFVATQEALAKGPEGKAELYHLVTDTAYTVRRQMVAASELYRGAAKPLMVIVMVPVMVTVMVPVMVVVMVPVMAPLMVFVATHALLSWRGSR